MKLFQIPLLLLVMLLMLVSGTGSAQDFSKNTWHYGEVNLFSGETIKGRIKYDLDNDNIMVSQQDGTVKSFGALKVESFEFFDEVLRVQRSFFTLPYRKVADYESPVFFELIAEGQLTLLNREAIVQQYVQTGYSPWGYRSMMTPVLVLTDSFYFLNSSGKVSKFNSQKSQLLELMHDRYTQVSDFMKDNRLNLNHREDMIKVLNYYNSFFTSKP